MDFCPDFPLRGFYVKKAKYYHYTCDIRLSHPTLTNNKYTLNYIKTLEAHYMLAASLDHELLVLALLIAKLEVVNILGLFVGIFSPSLRLRRF